MPAYILWPHSQATFIHRKTIETLVLCHEINHVTYFIGPTRPHNLVSNYPHLPTLITSHFLAFQTLQIFISSFQIPTTSAGSICMANCGQSSSIWEQPSPNPSSRTSGRSMALSSRASSGRSSSSWDHLLRRRARS